MPIYCIGEGKGIPLQCSCLENPRDGEAWGAAVYGVVQSRTWLKRLSSSSSSIYCIKEIFLKFVTVMLAHCGKCKQWQNIQNKKPPLKLTTSIPLSHSADHCEKCGQSSLILILQYLFYTFAKEEIYIVIIWCTVCLQIEVIDYCSAACLFSVTIIERHLAQLVLQIHFIQIFIERRSIKAFKCILWSKCLILVKKFYLKNMTN